MAMLSRVINTELTRDLQLDKIVGMAMLVVATTVFSYYTLWTLFMVHSMLSALRHY